MVTQRLFTFFDMFLSVLTIRDIFEYESGRGHLNVPPLLFVIKKGPISTVLTITTSDFCIK